MKTGRPSIYTKELADKICEEIALGASIRTVCKMEEMPSVATVFSWIRTDEEFSKQYARATQERTEAMSEDILDISDDGTNDWMLVNDREVPDQEAIQRSKLRVETRKWLMSKMKPKKYGDKLDLTSGGDKLPTPLLNVLNHNSDEKASEAK